MSSSTRNYFAYALIGIVFLVSSLLLVVYSISIQPLGVFGPPILRYNSYLILLALACSALGGFSLFRSGQSKPASPVVRKTLAEQVKSVKESQ